MILQPGLHPCLPTNQQADIFLGGVFCHVPVITLHQPHKNLVVLKSLFSELFRSAAQNRKAHVVSHIVSPLSVAIFSHHAQV